MFNKLLPLTFVIRYSEKYLENGVQINAISRIILSGPIDGFYYFIFNNNALFFFSIA